MTTICLIAAIVLYVIAGLHWVGVITINDFDVMSFLAFGLAFHAAAHLPWASWRLP